MKNNKNLEEEKIEWKKLWEVTIWNKKICRSREAQAAKNKQLPSLFFKRFKKN